MASRRTTSKAHEVLSDDVASLATTQKKPRGRPRSASLLASQAPVAPARKPRQKKSLMPQESASVPEPEAQPTTSKTKRQSKLPPAQPEAPSEVPPLKSKRQSKVPETAKQVTAASANKRQSKSRRATSVIPISSESEDEPEVQPKRSHKKAKEIESASSSRPSEVPKRKSRATSRQSKAAEAASTSPKASGKRKSKMVPEPEPESAAQPEQQSGPAAEPQAKKRGRPTKKSAEPEPEKKRARSTKKPAESETNAKPESEAPTAEPTSKPKRGRPKAKSSTATGEMPRVEGSPAPKGPEQSKASAKEPKPRAKQTKSNEKPSAEGSASAPTSRVKKTKGNEKTDADGAAAANTDEKQAKSKKMKEKKQNDVKELEAQSVPKQSPKRKRTLLDVDLHVELQSPARSRSKSPVVAPPAKRAPKRKSEAAPKEPVPEKSESKSRPEPSKQRGRRSKQPRAEPEAESAAGPPRVPVAVQESDDEVMTISFPQKQRKPKKAPTPEPGPSGAAAPVAVAQSEQPEQPDEANVAPAQVVPNIDGEAPAAASDEQRGASPVPAPALESRPKRGRKPAAAATVSGTAVAVAVAPAARPKAEKKKAAKEPVEHKVVVPIARLPRNSGQVLCLGENVSGQLGLNPLATAYRQRPQRTCNELTDIAYVAAGGMHSLAISDDGRAVYSWGCNDEGALGRHTCEDGNDETEEDKQQEWVPAPVQFPRPETIVMVTAGDSHSAALTDDGRVYVWGIFRMPAEGYMGLVERTQKAVELPVELPIEDLSEGEKIASIASGGHHMVLLSTRGRVFTLGEGSNGQLGRISDEQLVRNPEGHSEELLLDMLRPKPILPEKSFKNIAVGEFSTLVQTIDGEVYGFGLNRDGQLGFNCGDSTFCATPTKAMIPLEPNVGRMDWVKIIGGQAHTLALNSNGEVFVCGRHEYGRLGLGKESAEGIGALSAEADGDGSIVDLLTTHVNDLHEDAVDAAPVGVKHHKDDKLQPTMIRFFADNGIRLQAIAVGGHCSFAIDTDGHAYSWGQASSYQLARGDIEGDAWLPGLMTGKNLEHREVLQIAGGGQHAILLVSVPEDPAPKKARLSNGSAAPLELDGSAASGSQTTRPPSKNKDLAPSESQATQDSQEAATRAPGPMALAPAAPQLQTPAGLQPSAAEAFAGAPNGPVAAPSTSTLLPVPKTNNQTKAASPVHVQNRAASDVDETLQGDLLAVESDDEPVVAGLHDLPFPSASAATEAEAGEFDTL